MSTLMRAIRVNGVTYDVASNINEPMVSAADLALTLPDMIAIGDARIHDHHWINMGRPLYRCMGCNATSDSIAEIERMDSEQEAARANDRRAVGTTGKNHAATTQAPLSARVRQR